MGRTQTPKPNMGTVGKAIYGAAQFPVSLSSASEQRQAPMAVGLGPGLLGNNVQFCEGYQTIKDRTDWQVLPILPAAAEGR
jgi:hypothetical protein